jgi:hypothetical protein
MKIHAWYFSFWNCETDYFKGFLRSKWGVNQNPFCLQNHLTLEKFLFVSLSLPLPLPFFSLVFSFMSFFGVPFSSLLVFQDFALP